MSWGLKNNLLLVLVPRTQNPCCFHGSPSFYLGLLQLLQPILYGLLFYNFLQFLFLPDCLLLVFLYRFPLLQTLDVFLRVAFSFCFFFVVLFLQLFLLFEYFGLFFFKILQKMLKTGILLSLSFFILSSDKLFRNFKP